MRKSVFILIVLAAVLPVFADEYCNLELVDEWECPYTGYVGEWNSGLAYNQGYIYFPGRNHIYILEVDGSGYIDLETTALESSGYEHFGDIIVRGNLAVVCNAEHQLFYDVSNPLVFDSLGSVSGRVSNQLHFLDTLLIGDASRLNVINISDSTNPFYVTTFQKPWHNVYLSVVDPDIYPYILVPNEVMVDTDRRIYDGFINPIDITEDYAYSPWQLDWTEYYGSIKGLVKAGDLYFGLTPHLSIFYMDSAFAYTEVRKTFEISSFDYPPSFIQAVNDTVLFLSCSDNFALVNVADTSAIDVMARFRNTDAVGDHYEYYYDVVVMDSILYVFTKHSEVLRYVDTMLVKSYLLDMSFSGQCSYYDKPEELELKTYPNPFNSTLRISAPDKATVTIHDTRGRMVADLGKDRLWNAGEDVPSGVYIVRAVVGDVVVDGKAVLIR